MKGIRSTGKKKASLSLTVLLAFTMVLVGCGAGNSQTASNSPAPSTASSGNSSPAPSAASSASSQPKEEPVVSVFVNSANHDALTSAFQAFTKETGIAVKENEIPGITDDFYAKIDVAMQTSDTTDVVPLNNSIRAQQFTDNGWLKPINDLMGDYDPDKVFGKNLVKDNGTIYFLPDAANKWAVYYNKKIFDDAHVPYPTNNMTWDDYINIAKKLTDPAKGIYGSLMPPYNNLFYLMAEQELVPAYKADGTSNYDDPMFADSLKWYGDLANVDKIQPSWLEQATDKIIPPNFDNGNYAMLFNGTGFISQIANKAKFPRNFDVGIARIPVPADGKGNNNLSPGQGYGINKNAAHPNNAFLLVKWLAENDYTYLGYLPSRVDLTADQINDEANLLAKSTNNEITADEFTNAFINDGLGITNEKIGGLIAQQYSDILQQEGPLYLSGQQSLDATVKAIKDQADKAIATAKSAK